MPETVLRLPTLHVDQVRAYRAYLKYPRFVLRAGRRWGKTAFLETIICDCVARGGYVGYFVPQYKLSAEAFFEMAAILQPITASASKIDGVIRTTTGGRIDFWTLNQENAGRSRKYDNAVFDEAAFNEPGVKTIWERSVEPTLLDRDGRAIFASNANRLDEDNWFYQLHLMCEAGKPGYGEFHAPTRNNPHVPIRREGESDAAHALRRHETIEAIRREKHPLQFKAEYEAEFVDFSGVAFFSLDSMLAGGLPVEPPAGCGAVFATIDTATKTGRENDGTAVCYWALTPPLEGPHRLVLLDWDLQQIEGSLLEAWLPTVFARLEELAARCRARGGSAGAWIEDKASGMVLLQQAARRGWPAHAVDSKLTAMGKVERAISVSGYVYRGWVKLSREAHDRVVTYKGATRNHLLGQVLGFRVDDKDPHRPDDCLDAFTYGISVGIGGPEGF